MRQDIKNWIEALRSGEYQQGTGMAMDRNEDGKCFFCCLGVYASVLGVPEEAIEGKAFPQYGDAAQPPVPLKNCQVMGLGGGAVFITNDMQAWAKKKGLDFDGETCTSFATMNDELKWTFENIADFIEEFYDDEAA